MMEIEVKKRFSSFELDVAIRVPDGETLVLLGENGAGKSTVLNLVAGVLTPDSGRIVIGGRVFYDQPGKIDLPVEKRRTGCVFQNYALFPHLSVYENIAFGIPRSGRDRMQTASRIRDLAGLLGILHLADEHVHALSGGQRQKVALARALAREPDILLLDEPFSSLDTKTRHQLRGELREHLETFGIPAILVTHDHKDALALGDRVCLLEQGRVVLNGSAGDVLRGSRHRFSRGVSPSLPDYRRASQMV